MQKMDLGGLPGGVPGVGNLLPKGRALPKASPGGRFAWLAAAGCAGGFVAVLGERRKPKGELGSMVWTAARYM